MKNMGKSCGERVGTRTTVTVGSLGGKAATLVGVLTHAKRVTFGKLL